jgi:enoyl-CoA hydratase/3-hydroxyacyl-CoA dehydrogenase
MDAALVPTQDLALLKDCEYVLEAASEDLAIKQAILGKLEAVVAPSCLIGFATSGLPRAQIAASAKHPARCFVNHPFFPAWRSPPIEVVLSGDAALGAQMMATMKRLGKVPILTADVECFAADDIFCNYISEAARSSRPAWPRRRRSIASSTTRSAAAARSTSWTRPAATCSPRTARS